MHYTRNWRSFSLSPAAGERAGERGPQCRVSRGLISIPRAGVARWHQSGSSSTAGHKLIQPERRSGLHEPGTGHACGRRMGLVTGRAVANELVRVGRGDGRPEWHHPGEHADVLPRTRGGLHAAATAPYTQRHGAHSRWQFYDGGYSGWLCQRGSHHGQRVGVLHGHEFGDVEPLARRLCVCHQSS